MPVLVFGLLEDIRLSWHQSTDPARQECPLGMPPESVRGGDQVTRAPEPVGEGTVGELRGACETFVDAAAALTRGVEEAIDGGMELWWSLGRLMRAVCTLASTSTDAYLAMAGTR